MANGPILIISGTNRPDSNALKVANIIRGHYQRAVCLFQSLRAQVSAIRR